MDTLKLIQSRRTIHSFTTDAVPSAILEKALQAAVYAPNHKLTWPMKFYHLGQKSRARLAEIQVEIKNKKSENPMSENAAKAMREKFQSEGECLIVGIRKSGDANREREDYATLSAGLQNMALYLWSEGYGTKWSTGGILRHPGLYELVGESSDQIEICGVFKIGRALTVPPAAERPAKSQYFHVLP